MSPVRLACLNHAASVHSEPGSNSPKRVQNLVILELLNIVSRSSHLILLYLELLIGGPNQSYKVNFKEPSFWGSVPARTFVFRPSTPFRIISKKSSDKEQLFCFNLCTLYDQSRRVCGGGRRNMNGLQGGSSLF